ncbi:MAG: DUF1592 domain-containing protein [Verrucomicrobiota bacterium]
MSVFCNLALAAEDDFKQLLQPVFQDSCVKCHGKDDKVKGKVNLLELQSSSELSKNPELLEKLVEALDFEDMPPEDEPALDAATRKRLVLQLKEMLHASVSARKTLAQAPVRRMNRFQYNNAVTDLFDLNCVVFALPERMMREHQNYFKPASGKMPDKVVVGSRPLGKSQLIEKRLGGVTPFPQDLRAEHGFDNRGDHLSLSPLLLESFLKLSQSILQSSNFGPKTCGIWKAFFAEPDAEKNTETEIRKRLRPFLTRAFRHPVDGELLDRYTNYVLAQIQSGESFTDSMKAVASATIASPKFLYLYDTASQSEQIEALDDYDLASRLAFFLWGSIPDQPLLDLAASGKLSDPEVLSREVERMLNDHRLKRFCDSFPSQWLQLERIISSVPDREHFPDFYFLKYRASMHMMLEPLLLFETILIEDRPILELIDSDFTYRSAMLDKMYGVEKKGVKNQVRGIPFKRVALSDRRQGGIITNAAVMTMTSGPERTKPITRGAWLATVIFNDPPEPPPADVPPLAEKAPAEEANLTLRERLSAHRERADCAGCHEQIDPLGFALENYGPTGKWREVYENDRKVDMNGTLFRKHEFNDIVEFKDAVLAEKDRFVRGFAEHLLSFALAREVGVADGPALEKIAKATAADDYRIKSMIKHVVQSESFLQKSNPKVMASAVTGAKGKKSPANE